MKSLKWTKIAFTPLAVKAWEHINAQYLLAYHNSLHIKHMYDYLHDTNEPYDECLDWAVLFHDIVYDNQPEKELRSAKLFIEMSSKFQGCNLAPSYHARVYSLIMRTVDHIVMKEVKGSSAIIRADLHKLTIPKDVFNNYNYIISESKYLYKIDDETFADNNIKFMRGLYERMDQNITTDPTHEQFYNLVKRGIKSTINLSFILKGEL